MEPYQLYVFLVFKEYCSYLVFKEYCRYGPELASSSAFYPVHGYLLYL